MLDILLFVIAGLFMLLGILGCILPILPGPPLAYVGLLILQVTDPTPFGLKFMLIWLGITIVVTALDFLIPALGAKKYGGSRYGVLGTVIGLLAGLIFFPPFGIIIGPIAGALIGEIMYGRTHQEATRAAFGSFVGFLITTIVKLSASAVMVYYFFTVVF